VQADITQARVNLGWEPKVSFETGLAETVRWAIQQHGNDLQTKIAKRAI
jgi:nucleoside-diphosphate-sugar epimerase